MKYYYSIALSALCFFNTAHANFGKEIHGYMWANYNQSTGNTQTAHEWYKHLLNNNSSVYTYKGFINLLANTNNHKQIVNIMETVGDTFKNDSDVQIIFAHALRHVGRAKEANELFITLSQQFKTNLEITFEAARAYIEHKELENAKQVIDTLLNNTPKKPNYFVLHFLKAQINTQLNRPDEALKNVQESIAIHPHFDKGWLLFGMLQEKQGKLQDAIKGYTNYLEITPLADKQIERHLLELVMQHKGKQYNTSILLFNKNCYQKALILFKRKQYKQALEQIDRCLELNPDQTDTQLLKIQIMHAMHTYKDAANSLVQWIGKSPDNTVLLSTLHLLARSGAPIALIINAFEQLEQKNNTSHWPPIYLADLCTRTNNTQKALAYHKKALGLTKDKQLCAKIQFQIGLLHYERKEYDAMITTLESARTQGATFPPLLNLLAYYYATKGKKIDDAQKLITQVIKHDPHNPHFLDTQATIWYKQGKFEQARSLLYHLVRRVNDDAMILIHLGKTYNKMGNTSKALNFMHAAQKQAHTEYEQEYTKRLINRWSTA